MHQTKSAQAAAGVKTTPRGREDACETTVIKTVSLRGAGTQNDLCHLVAEYWTKDGKKIGEIVIS